MLLKLSIRLSMTMSQDCLALLPQDIQAKYLQNTHYKEIHMTTKTIMTDKQPRLGNKYIAKVSMDKDSYDIFELIEITEGITGIIIYVFNIHLRDTDII